MGRKGMESGRPQVVSVGGSWLPAPRGFLLPLGTGITFGFGCAYLLLSVLSLDHPAVAPWLLARRKPNSFLSATGPHSDHWEDEEPQAPEVPLAGHGPDDEFHHSGKGSSHSELLVLVRKTDETAPKFSATAPDCVPHVSHALSFGETTKEGKVGEMGSSKFLIF
ncbi:hypothetical protein HPB51_015664 [Rhipicephalus microplus]|uniref:Uncharacterized protein n=1 Tax=Rhipicephalus microplus TaxID=6941 RepID=A0A9J6D5K8_RHIMP|nr:hypothetical protein HPB51_015664 [Rhipicephalus microplus]